MKPCRVFLPILFLLGLYGCRQQPVLVVTDPWYDVLVSREFSGFNAAAYLTGQSLVDTRHDYHRITVADAREAQSTLDRWAQEDAVYLVSPLVYLWTRQVEIPRVKMVILEGEPRWASPGKSVVWTDYGDAMEKAGIWSGNRVAEKAGSLAAGIGTTGNGEDLEIFNRFRSGFLSVSPPDALVVQPAALSVEAAVEGLLQLAEKENVALWFYFGDASGISSLDSLRARGELFLCREGGPFLSHGGRVASVDTDRREIFKKALILVRKGQYGEAVSVPARFHPAKTKKKGNREEN